jgi:hypothetical protein
VSAAGPERAHSVVWWARKWKVHRNTARAWLRNLHEKYGEPVVQRVGKRRSYRASESSLRKVAVGPDPECVTHQQLTRALGEIWRAIDTMGGKATVVRKREMSNSAQ